MNNAINSEMLILARESRGMTQSALAKEAGVTQAAISKFEKGLKNPSEELLSNVSEILSYPVSFFYENEHRYPPATPFHRKRRSLPKKIQYQVEALANIRRIHISKLLESAELLDNEIVSFDIDDFAGDAAKIAKATRSYLRLPRGPIKNLTSLLESIGIIIMPCNFGSALFDGFTLICKGNNPVIFINRDFPGDRMRFTLAHEFGHIIMHSIYTPNMEDEANLFAAEFLVPGDEVKPSLSRVSINKLATLKPYWKVSIAMLIERAYNLGRIDYNQRRYLWTLMAKCGYKRREPHHLDISPEQPTLFQEIVDVHFSELNYTQDELYKILSTSKSDFLSLYPATTKRPYLRIVKQ